MAFAILRTSRTTNINKSFLHNLRIDPKYARHVDQSKTHLNEILIDKLDFASSKSGFEEKIDKYIKDSNIKVRKDNNVKCLEFLLTASPSFFNDAKKLEKWKSKQLDFLKTEFGDSLLLVVSHLDEKTPHIQAIILADTKKTMKYKNQKGDFYKEVHQIAPGDYNPEYLRNLQDRYAEHNKEFGLVRGLKNSKATHRTLKKFYEDVEKANSADYEKVVRKRVSSALKESSRLGFLSIDKALEAVTPILNEVLKSNKKIKTLLNYNTPSVVSDIEKLSKKLKKELLDASEKKDYYKDEIKEIESYKKKIYDLERKLKEFEEYKKEIEDKKNVAINSNIGSKRKI